VHPLGLGFGSRFIAQFWPGVVTDLEAQQVTHCVEDEIEFLVGVLGNMPIHLGDLVRGRLVMARDPHHECVLDRAVVYLDVWARTALRTERQEFAEGLLLEQSAELARRISLRR
jgi:hypothetical protein